MSYPPQGDLDSANRVLPPHLEIPGKPLLLSRDDSDRVTMSNTLRLMLMRTPSQLLDLRLLRAPGAVNSFA